MRRALTLFLAVIALLVWGGVGARSASAAWAAPQGVDAALESAPPADESPDAPLPDTDESQEGDAEVTDQEPSDDPGFLMHPVVVPDAWRQSTPAVRACIIGSPGDRAEPATRPPRAL